MTLTPSAAIFIFFAAAAGAGSVGIDFRPFFPEFYDFRRRVASAKKKSSMREYIV